MTKALSTKDLQIITDEPRVKDVRIGERLGMAQPLNIRQVIETNREELERYGLVHAVREPIKSGKGRIQEVTEYHLNEPQTLLLCMLSRTEKAADVRQEVISVYMAYRGSQKALSMSESEELRSSRLQITDLRERMRMQQELLETRQKIYAADKNDILFNTVVLLIRGGCISDEDIAKSIGLDIQQVKFARFHAEKV